MQMQQDQRAWLEAQQKMQEEILERNQRAQKEMLDAVLSASRAGVESPPPVFPEEGSNLHDLPCRNSPNRMTLKATWICSRGWLDSKGG